MLYMYSKYLDGPKLRVNTLGLFIHFNKRASAVKCILKCIIKTCIEKYDYKIKLSTLHF